MDVLANQKKPYSEKAQKNIDRIIDIWSTTRSKFGAEGPYLFGAKFNIADAYYAPVVLRFHFHQVDVPPSARQYMDAILSFPPVQEWVSAGQEETFHFEPLDGPVSK